MFKNIQIFKLAECKDRVCFNSHTQVPPIKIPTPISRNAITLFNACFNSEFKCQHKPLLKKHKPNFSRGNYALVKKIKQQII